MPVPASLSISVPRRGTVAEHGGSRVSQGGEGRIRRVTPEEKRAMAVQALKDRRYDVQAQRGWDLAMEETAAELQALRERVERAEAERDEARAEARKAWN